MSRSRLVAAVGLAICFLFATQIASAATITLDFSNMGTVQAETLSLNGVQISTSGGAELRLEQGRGLAVAGTGASDSLVETGESFLLNFTDAVDEVYFTFAFTSDGNLDTLAGVTRVYVWRSDGFALGYFNSFSDGQKYLDPYFAPGARFSALNFVPQNGDSMVLQSITFNAVPEPSTVFLMGSGLVGLGLIARRRRTRG